MTVKEKCKGCIHVEYCGGSATLETDSCFFKITAQEAVWKNPNKWIPCNERLPEERGCYIVTEKVFSLNDREHKGRYNTMVEQVEYYDGKWKRASFFEVVAWMPLPKPYQPEIPTDSEGSEE